MRSRFCLVLACVLPGCGPNVSAGGESSGTATGDTGTTTSGSDVSSSAQSDTTTGGLVESSSGVDVTSGQSSTSSGSSGVATSTGSTGSTGSTTGTESGDTTGLGDCPGQPGMGATAGDSCSANEDCVSGVCLLFQDVPEDDDAVCGAVMPDCSTRFTGTIRDIVSNAPVATSFGVIPILDALTDPVGAAPIISGVSDGGGTYDLASDGTFAAAIAVVGRVGGDGGYVVSGEPIANDIDGYSPGPDVHELWVVEQETLETWSSALDVPDDLVPLGAAGGAVGIVRDAEGNRVAGATIAIENGSESIVRFPQTDGGVGSTETDESGLFVIVGGVATGEAYVASADGLSGVGFSGSAPGIVFTLTITIE